MTKLIITADIHGMYTPWRTILEMLGPRDTLAVAGDLFDTRYGSPSKADYRPDKIRDEFTALKQTTHYVYGNCDDPRFLEGFTNTTTFRFEGLHCILNHGHHHLPDLTDYDIIIQGHSHVSRLDSVMGKVFMNPGSPAAPRNGYPSMAILENRELRIVNLINGKTVLDLSL